MRRGLALRIEQPVAVDVGIGRDFAPVDVAHDLIRLENLKREIFLLPVVDPVEILVVDAGPLRNEADLRAVDGAAFHTGKDHVDADCRLSFAAVELMKDGCCGGKLDVLAQRNPGKDGSAIGAVGDGDIRERLEEEVADLVFFDEFGICRFARFGRLLFFRIGRLLFGDLLQFGAQIAAGALLSGAENHVFAGVRAELIRKD